MCIYAENQTWVSCVVLLTRLNDFPSVIVSMSASNHRVFCDVYNHSAFSPIVADDVGHSVKVMSLGQCQLGRSRHVNSSTKLRVPQSHVILPASGPPVPCVRGSQHFFLLLYW